MPRFAFAIPVLVIACSAGGGPGLATGGGGQGQGHGGDPLGTGGTGPTTILPTISMGGTGGGGGGTSTCNHSLPATVRDFHNYDVKPNGHPDFGNLLGDDRKIVTHALGTDGKPVYAGSPTTDTTTGKDNFDQWYRDVADINMPVSISLPLTDIGGGVYSYDSSAYFPIDNQGFGIEDYQGHNYSFTTEIHTQFTYKGGEIFTFTGDDDVFVYINKRLVINLGGVHNPETGSVVLDAVASQIGIEVGGSYALDLFGAERHASGSNFRVDTTIECFVPSGPY